MFSSVDVGDDDDDDDVEGEEEEGEEDGEGDDDGDDVALNGSARINTLFTCASVIALLSAPVR